MGAQVAGDANSSLRYAATAEYSFTLATSSDLIAGLLDFTGHDSGRPADRSVDIDFSVSNFGKSLVDVSFKSLAAADAYFSDHALQLGNFSCNIDLLMSFTLSGQAADFSYVPSTGALTNPVP